MRPRRIGSSSGFAAVAGLSIFAGSAGCSSSAPAPEGFPAAPLTMLVTDGQKLKVDLRTSPDQPPTVGVDSVELVVTDGESGAPLDGLTVTMTPWMPAMGHGASVPPELQAMGKGRYVFTNVSLFMPGEWQLRTQFSGEVSDCVEPIFNVP